MLCSLLLRHNPKPGWFDRTVEGLLQGLSRGYARLLRSSLRQRWLVVLVMLASAVGSYLLFSQAKSELAPVEDRGVIFMPITAPDGATLPYTARYLDVVERIAQGYPEFDRVFVFAGNPSVTQGAAFLRTVDWTARSRSTQELARLLQPQVSGLPGVTAFPITPPSLGQGFRAQRPCWAGAM
ncbi:MAG: hypothetical protein C4K60_17925 [Ideonella sp. MAG2]|nr:MAG: hypothetical protein C4K60_17925 [Ideonella sp. MAG2]